MASVINYSISGGSTPFTDSTELAFLDAYAAGVFVSASAGNSGPGAATTDHVAPWVTTVAASTQTREFISTLTLTSGADTLVLTGASITAGVGHRCRWCCPRQRRTATTCARPRPHRDLHGQDSGLSARR